MKLGTLLVIWKTIVIAVLPRTTISSLLPHVSACAIESVAYLLWFLRLRSLASSYCLVIQLFLSGADLSRGGELVQKCNRSFVVVRCDARQGRSGKVFHQLKDIASCLGNAL